METLGSSYDSDEMLSDGDLIRWHVVDLLDQFPRGLEKEERIWKLYQEIIIKPKDEVSNSEIEQLYQEARK